MCILCVAPALLKLEIADILQYSISAVAQHGISEVSVDLENNQIISGRHFPYNSSVWPVWKPDGRWQLTIVYQRMNANTALLAAAVSNIANITAVFVSSRTSMDGSLWCTRSLRFPCRKRLKKTLLLLGRGYKVPLADSHRCVNILPHLFLLSFYKVSLPQDVKLYQHTNDILIEGISPDKVGEVAAALW